MPAIHLTRDKAEAEMFARQLRALGYRVQVLEVGGLIEVTTQEAVMSK